MRSLITLALLCLVAASGTAHAWRDGFYSQLAERIRTARGPKKTAQARMRQAVIPKRELDRLPGGGRHLANQPNGSFVDVATMSRNLRAFQRIDGGGVRRTRMRAFEQLVSKRAGRNPLGGVYVVSDLHLMPSMKPLFEAIADSGCGDGHLLLQGNRHSQQRKTIDDLTYHGSLVKTAEPGKLKAAYQDLLKRIIYRARKDPKARFIVLGHGGRIEARLATLVGKPGIPADLAQRVVVVGTSHKGQLRMRPVRERLARRGVPGGEVFPRVEIGDHWAKTIYESPTIGAGTAVTMHAELADLVRAGQRQFDRRRGKVLVLQVGYGNVGRANARALKRLGYEVAAFDPGAAASKHAAKDGVKMYGSLTQALAAGPRAIGCATGETPIPKAALSAIPEGAALFNLASPGELDSVLKSTTRLPAGRLPRVAGPSDHQHIPLAFGGRKFFIARGGQVINLARGAPEPDDYIQLTRGLIYLATLRGAELFGMNPGRYQLDRKQTRKFVADVQRDLRARGLGPLQRPTLEAFMPR